ncbi:hypothetical protein Ga0466249_002210 [Sporomusaceae bacterium BoRhaA]|uniref:hypothetical protein n=1 Tax=Pelorhabdus rhamnosifermentans TaxID=2772457 RepID=UPI001C05F83F|nr:hypothetical protein [Pelorhabdus rhamnosifermentans]MBU2701099.1 hypothetical protein [Pelorhabdus rhamnosifermentans]
MKLKQTGFIEALKFKRWKVIGKVFQEYGPPLVILAHRRQWEKTQNSRSAKRCSNKILRVGS